MYSWTAHRPPYLMHNTQNSPDTMYVNTSDSKYYAILYSRYSMYNTVCTYCTIETVSIQYTYVL